MQQDNNVFIFNHPLIQHKVTLLRDIETTSKEFRELTEELSMLMAYEVTRNLPLKEVDIETPICPTKAKKLADQKISLVPILRAGLGMVSGMQKLLPHARVGHIGLYRDHDSHEPVEYYCKLPEDISESEVILLDPMLATGGSGVAAVDFLKKRGAKNIKWVCIIASKVGIEVLHKAHPDVAIFCAAVDEVLNKDAYIVPGLGDAGDRLFGTK
ncbi:MAG: uracil phosphoribosyltransferase [Tissierellia bacterium]|jgi:uracil phosphoribosyltransferase|nr:uracil phosphoribosyltransferase [Bacillota bacterium]NLL22362.1 uracil phosphoribosyltransferase [Tissierellia bacterium]